jgi:hypothetical protein
MTHEDGPINAFPENYLSRWSGMKCEHRLMPVEPAKPAPASFWAALWHQPVARPSRLSRYTVANGLFYIAAGAAMYVLPVSDLVRMFFLDGLRGYEEGLARAVGVTVAIIGWFYVMGGRTRADSFGLATVLDRLAVPVLLVPLWLRGLAPPGMVLPFAVLDPVLGVGAYLIWRTDAGRR